MAGSALMVWSADTIPGYRALPRHCYPEPPKHLRTPISKVRLLVLAEVQLYKPEAGIIGSYDGDYMVPVVPCRQVLGIYTYVVVRSS